MATHYATDIYNHMPNSDGITPVELFSDTHFPHHKLKDIHVFEVFCASINDPSHSVQEETLAYHAALETDNVTGD